MVLNKEQEHFILVDNSSVVLCQTLTAPQLEMDNFQLRQELMESVVGAANIFAELFPEESKINMSSPRSDIQASSDTVVMNLAVMNRIPANSLTLSQLNSVHRLSAYLSKSKNCLNRLHRLFYRSYDNKKPPSEIEEIETNTEIVRLQDTLSKSKIQEGKILKALSATQSYLVNEVNRSVELDKELKNKENTLVRVTAERNKLLKFVDNVELKPDARRGGRSLQVQKEELLKTAESSSLVNSEVPETYIGSFVRKKFGSNSFFGLVVNFSRPFFKVSFLRRLYDLITLKLFSHHLDNILHSSKFD